MPGDSAFFVVNPAAGHGSAARAWSRVRPSLPGATPVAAHHLAPGEDAGRVAAAAARAGYRRVVAVGGDGTVSAVAAALGGTGSALGVVPAGRANDFARSLRLPRDPVAAAAVALAGPLERVDLGEVRTAAGTRLFVNVLGAGFPAHVAARAGRWGRLPLGGRPAYLLALLEALPRYAPAPVSLTLDGETVAREVGAVAVANGGWWGGGLRLAPRASLSDGWLDVYILSGVGRPGLLRLLPLVYAGRHERSPHVAVARAREIGLAAPTAVPLEADGEPAGKLPATIHLRPLALACAVQTPAADGRRVTSPG